MYFVVLVFRTIILVNEAVYIVVSRRREVKEKCNSQENLQTTGKNGRDCQIISHRAEWYNVISKLVAA